MNKIKYTEFLEIYKKLSEAYQQVIMIMLWDMENHISDKVDYAFALEMAMYESRYSVEALAKALEQAERKRLNLPKDASALVSQETVKSVIKRGSTKSMYYDQILQILDVNDEYLRDIYSSYSHTHVQYRFEHLSEQNQHALYRLVKNLLNIKEIEANIEKHNRELEERWNNPKPLGVIESDA